MTEKKFDMKNLYWFSCVGVNLFQCATKFYCKFSKNHNLRVNAIVYKPANAIKIKYWIQNNLFDGKLK